MTLFNEWKEKIESSLSSEDLKVVKSCTAVFAQYNASVVDSEVNLSVSISAPSTPQPTKGAPSFPSKS